MTAPDATDRVAFDLASQIAQRVHREQGYIPAPLAVARMQLDTTAAPRALASLIVAAPGIAAEIIASLAANPFAEAWPD